MKQIVITDHALVRYLERVHGINFAPIKKEIADIVQRAANVGAESVKANGFTYCLSANKHGGVTVNTIVPGSRSDESRVAAHYAKKRNLTA